MTDQVLGFAAEFKDRASASMARLGQSYQNLRSKASGAVAGLMADQSKMMTLGMVGGAMAMAGSKITGFFKKAANEAETFEVAMANLGFVTKALPSDMAEMKKFVLDLGASTIYSAKEVAEAWTNLVTAGGLDAKVAKAAVEDTMNFSTMSAGTVDLSTAADFAAAMINKFQLRVDGAGSSVMINGKRVTELTRAFDMLAQSTIYTGFKMRDFPIAFNSMRTAAMNMNMSIQDSVTLMGTLRAAGMQPAEAGLALNQISTGVSMFAAKLVKLEEGVMGRTGGKRDQMVYKLFGGKDAFQKALSDSKGDVGRLFDFYDKALAGLEAYEKGKGGLLAMGMTRELMKTSAAQSAMKIFSLQKFTVPEGGIQQVDKWGRFIDKFGKVVTDRTKAVQLFAAGVELTGIQAMRARSAMIAMSSGVSASYKNMIERTSWGIKKLKEGIVQNFMIVLGEAILPVLNAFREVIAKVVSFITKLFIAVPILPKILGPLGLLAGVLLLVGGTFMVASMGALFLKKSLMSLGVSLIGFFKKLILGGFALLKNPIFWLIVAIAFLAYLVYQFIKNWDKLSPVVKVLGIFALAVAAITVAIWAMNIALYANPIIWVVAAILLVIAAIVLLIVYWDDVWAAVKKFAAKAWEAIKGFFQDVWNIIKAVGNAIWAALVWLWEGIKSVAAVIFWPIEQAILGIKAVFIAAVNAMLAIWEFFASRVEGIGRFLGGLFTLNFKKAWSGVKQTVTGKDYSYEYDPTKAAAKQTADAVQQSFSSPDAWAGQTAPGPALPPRALGGGVFKNSPYLVGERGPEMFVPSNTGGILSNSNLGQLMAGMSGSSRTENKLIVQLDNIPQGATADDIGRAVEMALTARGIPFKDIFGSLDIVPTF